MKILIISDIHSNYEALLAVAGAEQTDAVWCLGDLVDLVRCRRNACSGCDIVLDKIA
jgi:predicted phosphodiesterase